MDQRRFPLPLPWCRSDSELWGLTTWSDYSAKVLPERERGRRGRFRKRRVSGSEERRTGLASTTKTPACTSPWTGDLRIKRSEPLPRPRKPRPLVFLFWTVHGPFSLFIRGIKRENGGCNGPAIIMAVDSPARQGEQDPPPRRAGQTPAPPPTPGQWRTWARNRPAPPRSDRNSGG